jgi:hypothetical protein
MSPNGEIVMGSLGSTTFGPIPVNQKEKIKDKIAVRQFYPLGHIRLGRHRSGRLS